MSCAEEHPYEYLDSVLRDNRRLQGELERAAARAGELESVVRRMWPHFMSSDVTVGEFADVGNMIAGLGVDLDG